MQKTPTAKKNSRKTHKKEETPDYDTEDHVRDREAEKSPEMTIKALLNTKSGAGERINKVQYRNLAIIPFNLGKDSRDEEEKLG